MTPAEILERAADEMERRGKTDYGYCDDGGRVCVITAVALVHGQPLDRLAICDWDVRTSQRVTPAWREALLGAFNGVATWSDSNDQATVVAGLRAVAATLRAQEARLLPVVVKPELVTP